MSHLVMADRQAVERKPRHGQPCNGCGLCCMAELCPLALSVFGKKPGPCPALMLERTADGQPRKFVCGLVVSEAIPPPLREAAALLIGSGQGCDARINGEPADVAFYIRLALDDEINKDALAAARRMWGAGP